ncbi:type I pullulanase [Paenalkalicoccus suaedae]|uniref:Type I pullulanase n=1 Tax=Paenalkalicoccus suaedae TaxID=2592382 RepID=A0A859FHH6_9BACI|nr:type I pullulanase [Paenalkalicoccus suaedae]QKS72102.1 type I pullulanase [Paenalkalicoccus suaedae]
MSQTKVWLDDIQFITVDAADIQRPFTLTVKSPTTSYTAAYQQMVNGGSWLYFIDIEVDVSRDLTVEINDISYPVYLRGVVRSDAFDKAFRADDLEYGAIPSDSATLFRVWSPVASSINVKIDGARYAMKKLDRGVYEFTLHKNAHGASYVYEATIYGEVEQIVDPYAKAVTTNSLAAVVYDSTQVRSHAFDTSTRPKVRHLQNSVIYELHVRDATIHPDSGVTHKGKYLGLTERHTNTSDGYSTGLSYIKELGVTHVQLLPLNDFGRVDDLAPDDMYNWGYDPLFFLTPEGSYSTDPTDPFNRIIELKEMIAAFHQEQLSIIVDVVFNHVFIMEESPFEQLVPGYYFRYDHEGQVSNGTGVGNDFASEKRMGRAFILHAIDYWLSHYQVDGFRFDLMGATDIETMQQIISRCEQEPEPVMLLGEGWELATALPYEEKTTSYQSEKVPGLRFFNDVFRDTLKGNTFDFYEYGYVNGKGRYIERMEQLFKGSSDESLAFPPFVSHVTQTINYVEVHDNHTLWDRIDSANRNEDLLDKQEMQKLATAITILSQGVPFIHAGQEFFRTKGGDGNSYISGDEVNALDWERRSRFEKDIAFIRSLLEVRKKYDVFRMHTKAEINQRFHPLQTPAPVFGFTLLASKQDFVVYVNPTKRRYQIQLPATGDWSVLASNKRKETNIVGEFFELDQYECFVAKKSRL